MCLVRGRTVGLAVGDAPTSNIWQQWDKDKWEVVSDQLINLGASNDDGRNRYTINRTYPIFKNMLYDSSDASTQTTNKYWLFFTSNDSTLPSPILWLTWTFTYIDI